MPGAEEQLYNDLREAGLTWDEGPQVGGDCGPYRQSERTAIYREHAGHLLAGPHAYRCFCSADRLASLAAHRRSLGLPTDYDRTCESLSVGESEERAARGDPFVVRLRAPERYPVFRDLVYGTVGDKSTAGPGGATAITHKHGEIAYEDPVLLKSDGHPTYHLANVIDDHLMRITHVVRATEWLSSTPKHLALYAAFGWQPPVFAHVGLLVDAEGHKLSKRSGSFDATLANFRSEGVLPVALLNFAALLGWSHHRKSDVMTLEQLVDEFRPRFTKGNTTVALEKLSFLQRAHVSRIAALPVEDEEFQALVDAVAPPIAQQIDSVTDERPLLTEHAAIRTRVAALLRANASNFVDPLQFYDRNRNFFFPLPPDAPTASSSSSRESDADWDEKLALLGAIHAALFTPSSGADVPVLDWTAAPALDTLVRLVCMGDEASRTSDATEASAPSSKPLKLVTPEQKTRYRLACSVMRAALLGGADGPGVAASLAILGREESEGRVRRFLEMGQA